MNTLELQRLILATDLMPTEKLVGMALALHLSVSSMTIRIRQQTLARECGLSARSIRRAISGLVAVGLFESKRTGRATILIPLDGAESVKNSGIVERSLVTYQIGHGRPIRRRQRSMPWELDTTLSTPAEELHKREEAREAKAALRHARTSQRTDAP